MAAQMSTTEAKQAAYKWHPFKCCRCGAIQSCAHTLNRFDCDICDRCDHNQRWTQCQICAPTVSRGDGLGCCEAELQASDFY